MNKSDIFEESLQEIARFARVISHPARLMILQYLANTKTCISGDISKHLPLGRTTVSQHLKELKEMGLIHGEIDGLKINYCLCSTTINNYLEKFEEFMDLIKKAGVACEANKHSCNN